MSWGHGRRSFRQAVEKKISTRDVAAITASLFGEGMMARARSGAVHWEKVSKPVPAKVVDAIMASHFKVVAPALRRNAAWRMQRRSLHAMTSPVPATAVEGSTIAIIRDMRSALRQSNFVAAGGTSIRGLLSAKRLTRQRFFGILFHMNLQEVQKRILPVLKRSDIAYAGVFGSVARGEATAGSDIDILVKFKQPATFSAYLQLDDLLREVLGRDVDLLTEGGVNKYLRPFIEKDLTLIYGTR